MRVLSYNAAAADYQAWRDHRDWTARKYAMWERGEKPASDSSRIRPTISADRASAIFEKVRPRPGTGGYKTQSRLVAPIGGSNAPHIRGNIRRDIETRRCLASEFSMSELEQRW